MLLSIDLMFSQLNCSAHSNMLSCEVTVTKIFFASTCFYSVRTALSSLIIRPVLQLGPNTPAPPSKLPKNFNGCHLWGIIQRTLHIASFVFSFPATVTLCLASLIRIDITGLGVQLDALLLKALTSMETEFLSLLHLALSQRYLMVMIFLHKWMMLKWMSRQIH